MEPKEFKVLKDQSIDVWESLGKIKYGPTNLEKKSLKYRRSIFISKNVKKNEEANSSNLRVIRPATGMDPKYYFKILGKKFSKNLAKGTPLKKIHLK